MSMNKTKLKDRYVFPAIFEYCEESYTVTFPDLPGCITEGKDVDEALKMAKEAMELHIYNMEDDKEKIPAPSKPESIKLPKHSFTSLIEVWMPPVRNEMRNEYIKKTLTIPKWLNDIVLEKKLNFSQLLQVAVKSKLGLL